MAYENNTYVDLFGTEADAVDFYRSFFGATPSDDQIKSHLTLSFFKIQGLFGRIRNFELDEDTKRSHDIKTAVCFEAQSNISINADVAQLANGGYNQTTGANTNIISEKMGNITTTYEKGSAGGVAGQAEKIKAEFGLTSSNACTILARYIRKTYGWN